jgi:hypothetical protein
MTCYCLIHAHIYQCIMEEEKINILFYSILFYSTCVGSTTTAPPAARKRRRRLIRRRGRRGEGAVGSRRDRYSRHSAASLAGIRGSGPRPHLRPRFVSSVGDPDPEPDPDPPVFGPYGFISHRDGSGSFPFPIKVLSGPI